jgi:hypothetical protein
VDGVVELEMSIPDSFTNYRAFKFPWKTNLFVTNPDSIFFESVSVGDSASISVDLINNSADQVDITGYYNENEDYIIENPVPFTLPAFGTVSLHIKFVPSKDGFFKDYLHIRSDTETSRIAQVMILTGRTDTIFTDVKKDEIIYNYVLEQNYPNPFNPGTTIRYKIAKSGNVNLDIFNISGERITRLISEVHQPGDYEIYWDGRDDNSQEVTSGVYIYRIWTGQSTISKKMMLLK